MLAAQMRRAEKRSAIRHLGAAGGNGGWRFAYPPYTSSSVVGASLPIGGHSFPAADRHSLPAHRPSQSPLHRFSAALLSRVRLIASRKVLADMALDDSVTIEIDDIQEYFK